MMSKNSFWVRLRENGRRRYWVWILCFLAFLIAMPLRMLTTINGRLAYRQWMEKEEFAQYMIRTTEQLFLPDTVMIALLCAGAILCGLQGFSYLYQRVKVDMYHSQPVKKNVRFLAIYCNGALYFVLPYLVNLLLQFGIAAYYQYLTKEMLLASLVSAAFVIIAFLAIYHTVILVVTLTGNYLSFSLGIGAFLGIEWGLRQLICLYSATYFQTYSSKSENAIKTPIFSVAAIFLQAVRNVRLYTGRLSAGWVAGQMGSYMVKIIVIGIVTFFLALLVYHLRAEENCGKALVFRWMRPVTKLVAVVFTALTAGWIMSSLTDKNLVLTIVALVGSGIFAHCILQIIFDLHFKAILGRWWELLFGLMVAFGIFAGFQWDITGFDTRIPAQDKVESVGILLNAQEMDMGYEGRDYYTDHMFLEDYSLIEKLVAADYIHQTGERIDNLRESSYSSLTMLYRMKNGSQKYRTYYIDMASQAELMQQIMSSEAYKKGVFPVFEEDYLQQKKNVEIRLDSYLANWGEITSDVAPQLVEALRKDLERYDYETVSNAHMIGTLQIGAKYDPALGTHQLATDYYALFDTYENTLAFLEENGYIDLSMDMTDRMVRVTVSYYEGEETSPDQQYYEETYSDPEMIRQICESCENTTYGYWWRDQSQYVDGVYVNGYLNNGSYIDFRLKKGSKLPEQVAKAIHFVQE